MRKALKWFVIFLPWGLLVGVLYAFIASAFGDFLDSTTQDHTLAYNNFFANLAYDGCVPREAVIAEAEARGWWYRELAEPLPYCHAPVGLTDWIHVDVSPSLPFSSEGENAAYVGFDAQGCMAEWDYTSGPGSTCQDR